MSAHTHLGRRENNEDAFKLDPDLGLFSVADGMGGYDGGEVASRLTVRALHTFARDYARADESSEDADIEDERLLEQAIRHANREVIGQRVGRLARMGATVATALVRPGRIVVAHVGDSRVYRFRGGQLEQLTRDHSLYTELKLASGAANDAALYEETGHVLTRAVGVPGICMADTHTENAYADDIYLLCTDGLSDVLDDITIARMLREHDIMDAAGALVREAFLRGGDDNITAVVFATD